MVHMDRQLEQHLSEKTSSVGLLGGGVLLVAGALGGGDNLLLGGFQDSGTTLHLSVRVEANHDSQVLERVLLLSVVTTGVGLLRTKSLLNFIRVNQTGEVRVGHDVAGKSVSSLGGGNAFGRAVHFVGALEGFSGPDDEATKVATRSELEKVEAINVSKVDTRQVAEGLNDTVVVGKDDKRTTALDVTAAAKLASAGADLTRVLGFLDIFVGTETLKDSDGFLGLGDGFGSGNNKRELRDLLHLVTTGHDQRGQGRGGNGRHNSITLLVSVELAVPLAPGLGRGEHATAAAHVTKGGLSSAGGTSTADTRDTGDSATGTPRVGRVLHAGHDVDGVGLTTVLVHVGVNELDDIRTNRGQEDGRQGSLGVLSILIGAEDGDDRAGSHVAY